MRRLILPAILLLAFLLRVLWIDKYPVGFTPDEASFGYDAYSILKTGKDQWGESFPVVLKSFGDYKSPLYSYLTIPSVAIFGLNKFSVRLPNAILGTLSVYGLFILTRELGKRLKRIDERIQPGRLAILAALLLAVSPWHVMLSRGAFEANLTTFFLPLGLYLFLTKRFLWAGVILGLNLFTYHSAKVVTPLVFGALIIYSKEKIKNLYPSLISFAVFMTLTIYTFYIGAGARVSERSISNGALEVGAKAKIELIQKGMHPILARALHNKYQVTASRFVDNYIQYFSPRFLIFDGPAETTYGMVLGLGVLTYVEIAGIISLIIFFKKVKDKRLLLFLLFWILVAPIPAALSTGVGYAGNRAIGMVPSIQIIASLGLYLFLQRLSYAKYLVGGLAYVGLIFFLYKYVALSPRDSAKGMLAGNLEYAEKVVSMKDKYDNIVVPRSLSEPHIYIAFVGRYDPKKYQQETINWNLDSNRVSWVDQLPEYALGNFIFK